MYAYYPLPRPSPSALTEMDSRSDRHSASLGTREAAVALRARPGLTGLVSRESSWGLPSYTALFSLLYKI